MNISFYTSVNSPPTSLLTVGPALSYVNVQSGAFSCCERDLRVFRKTEWVCLKRTVFLQSSLSTSSHSSQSK